MNATTSNEPMITFEGASKTYPDGTVAVHPLDLQVNKGEVCVLVGASGCGKTTTMRMINRLQEPTTGRVVAIVVEAREAEEERHRRAQLSQELAPPRQ